MNAVCPVNGPRNLCPSINQSDSKLQPSAILSFFFPHTLGGLLVFTSSFDGCHDIFPQF